MKIGVIFYPNPEGDVVDIQADIIGPGKHFRLSPFLTYLNCINLLMVCEW